MKKHMFFYVVVMVMGFSVLGACQPKDRVTKKLTALQTALELTSEQAETIKQLLTAQQEQEAKDRELYSDNSEEFNAARKELNKSTTKAIEEILTDEQKTKYQEYRKERRKKKGERQDRRDAEPRSNE